MRMYEKIAGVWGAGGAHDAPPDPKLDPNGSHSHTAIRAFGSSWIAVPKL